MVRMPMPSRKGNRTMIAQLALDEQLIIVKSDSRFSGMQGFWT